jgi:hypothetical protein
MKDPLEGIRDNSRELSGEFSGNFSGNFSRGSTEFTGSSKDLSSSKNPIVLETFHNGILETHKPELRDIYRESPRDIYRESHSSQGDTYNSPEESHYSQRKKVKKRTLLAKKVTLVHLVDSLGGIRKNLMI